ncbi:hypothetical protein [Methylobacterium bullatum]|uniref:Uncharacterized protein n=1 Tax=Methylobacterium bullatum TaxID=570505 RepID=A0AAV4ZDX1_9HYPH|nr:hypothetical protein [Methylobacterium bullatum]MBD8902435.1 hypothetical protein [Methylobacterium bullatum]GJD42015.1 hypothetical protein OICFNHDK_4506 [Methylobacterium bullatum]
MNRTIFHDANEISIQRLLAKYLSDAPRHASALYSGATIFIEPSRHRTGIPPDAICQRYMITHVGEEWSIVVRAVWRDGELYRPTATHTRIEEYTDLRSRYGTDEQSVATAVNAWLRRQDDL